MLLQSKARNLQCKHSAWMGGDVFCHCPEQCWEDIPELGVVPVLRSAVSLASSEYWCKTEVPWWLAQAAPQDFCGACVYCLGGNIAPEII